MKILRSFERSTSSPSQPEQGSRWNVPLSIFALLLGLLALAALILEYGFPITGEQLQLIDLATDGILIGFILQAAVRLIVTRRPLEVLSGRKWEYSVIAVILLGIIFPDDIGEILHRIDPALAPKTLTKLYVVASQLFILAALVPSLLRLSRRIMAANVQPSLIMLLSFIGMIAAGTGLLMMPRAASIDMTFIDALFTATSAVCVTGLIVVDTQTAFTPLGHWILLVLIQVGGLGIMTLTTFFGFVIGGSSRLKEYATLQSLVGEENLGEIRRTVFEIALLTFLIEAVGAGMLYMVVEKTGVTGQPLFFSVFHSISAFCNAGFTLTTENLAHPLLQNNTGFLGAIMVLVICGGIGIPVLGNIRETLAGIIMRKTLRPRLSLHSKLVAITSLVLILGGALLLIALERETTGAGMTGPEQMLSSVFQSVIARTAGFNTVDIGAMTPAALFIIIILMWVGASPGSTGGGVKTSTVAVALLNIRMLLTGRKHIEVFRKAVAPVAVMRAFSTIALSFAFIALSLFLLLLVEQAPFLALLFEVVSALSTVGLSTGITASLSTPGKWIIIVTMIAGRVGLLAILLAITRGRRDTEQYSYATENVVIT